MTPEDRLDRIDELVAKDPAYRALIHQGTALEQSMSRTLSTLPMQTQELIWDYIMHCEDMSRYVLKLACTHMIFEKEDH